MGMALPPSRSGCASYGTPLGPSSPRGEPERVRSPRAEPLLADAGAAALGGGADGRLAAQHRLVDRTPIHVRHSRRYGPTHRMLPGATSSYCAAKKEKFCGYRLVVLTTLDGIMTDCELLPAKADEREGAWPDAALPAVGGPPTCRFPAERVFPVSRNGRLRSAVLRHLSQSSRCSWTNSSSFCSG